MTLPLKIQEDNFRPKWTNFNCLYTWEKIHWPVVCRGLCALVWLDDSSKREREREKESTFRARSEGMWAVASSHLVCHWPNERIERGWREGDYQRWRNGLIERTPKFTQQVGPVAGDQDFFLGPVCWSCDSNSFGTRSEGVRTRAHLIPANFHSGHGATGEKPGEKKGTLQQMTTKVSLTQPSRCIPIWQSHRFHLSFSSAIFVCAWDRAKFHLNIAGCWDFSQKATKAGQGQWPVAIWAKGSGATSFFGGLSLHLAMLSHNCGK